MADSQDGGGDGRSGWIAPLIIIVAIVLALGASRRSSSDTTTSTTGSNTITSSLTGSAPPVAPGASSGAPALANCPGSVVAQRTESDIVLKIYYDPQEDGLNCVQATRRGGVTSSGYIRTELRFASYPGSAWPEYAWHAGPAGVGDVSGTYLTVTDHRCVTAVATYYPAEGGGTTSDASLTHVACG